MKLQIKFFPWQHYAHSEKSIRIMQLVFDLFKSYFVWVYKGQQYR